MSFLFFLIGVANAFDINVEKYETINKWYKTPDIIVCSDSSVTQMQVYKAAQEWKKSGVNIGHVKKEKNNECSDKHERGFILIMGDRDDLNAKENHAITIRWYDRSSTSRNKIVNSAFVEIDPVTIKNQPGDIHKLLTHEIGHALGYKHTCIKNDIMITEIMN